MSVEKFQTVRGMRDFLPEEMRKREYMFDVIRSVFRQYGYEPLETPALENFDLFASKGAGGEEIRKEIYSFKDQGGRELGMRFDLTVPTARLVSTLLNLPMPFKRYMIGRVWRYDRPQSGRYREFWQADVDSFGTENGVSDAEAVAVACTCLEKLGFDDFFVRINNRKLLEGIALACGVSEKKVMDALRCIDKRDKIGEQGVKQELMECGIPFEVCDKLMKIFERDVDAGEFKGKKLEEGLKELNEVLNALEAFGMKDRAKVDLSLARGLDYYTGCVFEATVEGGKWSVAGGGRYDSMIEDFGGKPTPATGISLGVERIMVLMEERGLFKTETHTQVYVAPVNDETRPKALEIAQKLRNVGLNVETDLMKRNLRKQLDYANSRNIQRVVIVGPKDLENEEVTVRDMKSGEEEKVRLGKLESYFPA
jgi:histidyl-tRNA synthetase